MLFNEFIVWYLFLGGLGAGLTFVLFLITLGARKRTAWNHLSKIIRVPSLILALLATGFGSILLMKDLGRPDKALLLFTQPTLSAISVGTFALTALLMCLAALLAFTLRNSEHRSFQTKEAKRNSSRLGVILEVVTAVAALVVMIYTGLFLNSITAVPFWISIFIPILFVLSALSCGVALVLVVAVVKMYGRKGNFLPLGTLIVFDSMLIGLEILAVIALGIQSFSSDAALVAVSSLASGELFYHFWIGFIACGLVIPLMLELAFIKRFYGQTGLYIVLGCLLLIGGFYLRYCTIFAGEHLSVYLFA